jgi:hypothetical protein
METLSTPKSTYRITIEAERDDRPVGDNTDTYVDVADEETFYGTAEEAAAHAQALLEMARAVDAGERHGCDDEIPTWSYSSKITAVDGDDEDKTAATDTAVFTETGTAITPAQARRILDARAAYQALHEPALAARVRSDAATLSGLPYDHPDRRAARLAHHAALDACNAAAMRIIRAENDARIDVGWRGLPTYLAALADIAA